MTNLHVQFSDNTETVIVSWFGSPQDPDVYPNLGVVQTSDPRWKVYYDSLPTEFQQNLPEPT